MPPFLMCDRGNDNRPVDKNGAIPLKALCDESFLDQGSDHKHLPNPTDHVLPVPTGAAFESPGVQVQGHGRPGSEVRIRCSDHGTVQPRPDGVADHEAPDVAAGLMLTMGPPRSMDAETTRPQPHTNQITSMYFHGRPLRMGWWIRSWSVLGRLSGCSEFPANASIR
jgi:hypothetical protein